MAQSLPAHILTPALWHCKQPGGDYCNTSIHPALKKADS